MTRKPFTDNQFSPLSPAPYYSRVPSQELSAGNDSKNYVLLGFRPGYSLQASELNEIQENFLLQQTLFATMMSNWWASDTNFGPGWGSSDATDPFLSEGSRGGGLTPISPLLVQVSGGTITFNPGWYLAQIPIFNTGAGTPSDERNFKVFIYLENTLTSTFNSSDNGFIGFDIEQEYVTEGEDTTLNDNAAGIPTTNSPGATRYQLVINGLVKEGVISGIDGTSSADKSPMAIKVENGIVQYLNGYVLTP